MIVTLTPDDPPAPRRIRRRRSTWHLSRQERERLAAEAEREQAAAERLRRILNEQFTRPPR